MRERSERQQEFVSSSPSSRVGGRWDRDIADDLEPLRVDMHSLVEEPQVAAVLGNSKRLAARFLDEHPGLLIDRGPHRPRAVRLSDLVEDACRAGLATDIDALKWASLPEVGAALGMEPNHCRTLAYEGCFGELRWEGQ
jgi:hypothetical protein